MVHNDILWDFYFKNASTAQIACPGPAMQDCLFYTIFVFPIAMEIPPDIARNNNAAAARRVGTRSLVDNITSAIFISRTALDAKRGMNGNNHFISPGVLKRRKLLTYG